MSAINEKSPRVSLVLAVSALIVVGCTSPEKKLIAACEKGNELVVVVKPHALDGKDSACNRCLEGKADELLAPTRSDPHLAGVIAACPNTDELCGHNGFTDCGCVARTVTTDGCREWYAKMTEALFSCKGVCEKEPPQSSGAAVPPGTMP